MFFWILLLAHEIADFPLQIDPIYRLKRTSRWGVIPHTLICTIVNILVLLPFLSFLKVWYAIVFLSIVHFLFDQAKIAVFSKSTGDNFSNFLLDQMLHVFSVWIVAWWLDSIVDLGTVAVPSIYHNISLIFALSLLIFATFGGTPIIFYTQKFWNDRKNNTTTIYPVGLKRAIGILERGCATTAIFAGGWGFVIAVLFFIPGYFLDQAASAQEKLVNALTGLAISISCAVIYNFIIQTL